MANIFSNILDNLVQEHMERSLNVGIVIYVKQ